MTAENQASRGLRPPDTATSPDRPPSMLALMARGYAFPVSRPLHCCSCAFYPICYTALGIAAVLELFAEISALSALGVLIVSSSRFAVDWQQSILSDDPRPPKLRTLPDIRDIKTAGLLLVVLSPVSGAVALLSGDAPLPTSFGSRLALLGAGAAGAVGVFSVLGLVFPAVVARNRHPWRSTRTFTLRLVPAFAVVSILAVLSGTLLVASVAYLATTVVGDLAFRNPGVPGTVAFVILVFATMLMFFVVVVAPPATVVALAYRSQGLDIALPSSGSARLQTTPGSVLSLAADPEQLEASTKALAIMIVSVIGLLWTLKSRWAALIALPLLLQLSYTLLYQLSVVSAKERIEVDDQAIRWVSAFDECVIFLRDVSEVQVRRVGLGWFVLGLVFADLDQALKHDFYRRRGEPRGFARVVMALHRWTIGVLMHIDVWGVAKGLKAGRLPSGLGARVDLYLEGDAALLKDTCRFNFQRCGVHIIFPTLSPNSRVMECARELDRRRKAAIALVQAPVSQV